jgi:hypothetical protein
MRAPLSPALEQRVRCPDPTARVFIEAQTETLADVRTRKDQWSLADSTTGLELLDDGGVRLTDAIQVKIARASPGDGFNTDLDGPPSLVAASPFLTARIVWGGDDPRDLVIDRITAYLHPQQNGALARTVDTWICQPYAVRKSTGTTAVELVPLAAPVAMKAVGVSVGDVVFSWVGQATKPKPKSILPFVAAPPEFGSPVTVIFIWAVKADGSPATNVGWASDSAVTQVTNGSRILKAIQVAGPTLLGAYSFDITPHPVPIIKVESGSFANAKIQFSTGGNQFDLGATPTGTIEFVGEGEVPAGGAIIYEVLKDGGTAATDADWRAYTDGQHPADLANVSTRQTYQLRARLQTSAGGDVTPILRALGVREVAITDLSNVCQTPEVSWSVDPIKLVGAIPELRLTAVRDGERDFHDAITDLLVSADIGKLLLRVWIGDAAVPRSQWVKRDEFLIDGVYPGGPSIALRCVSPLALLKGSLPKYAGGISAAPASDQANPGAWVDESSASTNLFSKVNEITADDLGFVQSPVDPANAAVEFKLASLGDPNLSGGHSVSYRYQKDVAAGKTIDLTVELRQGAVVKATQTVVNIANGWITGVLQLTTTQADSITDYSDLRIRFNANTTGGAGSRKAQVSWTKFGVDGSRQAYLKASQTPKAVYEDLVLNQAEMPRRYFGPGAELTSELVTNEIRDITDIKAQVDAIAYIAGMAVTSSQGRIKAVDCHGQKAAVVTFDPNEIEPLETTPGYEERVPFFTVPWGYDFVKNKFGAETLAKSGPALNKLGRAHVDVEERLDETIARWIVAQAGDTPGESSQANRIAKRVVETVGTGLIRWRFRTTYAWPELEPGDLVVVPTDRFVARDPTADRELRGQLWAAGVITAVGDVWGRDFTIWVRSYADIVGGTVLGTRQGFAVPEIDDLQVQVRPGFPPTGLLQARTTKAKSLKYAASTSAYPTAATVRAAAANAVDSNGGFVSGSLGSVAGGQVLYVSAFAYENADGTGAESVLAQAETKPSPIMRGVIADDNKYAMTASDTAGKETDDDLFISASKTLKVGTVASPSAITKTIIVPFGEMIPETNTTTWLCFTTGYITANTVNVTQNFYASVVLPRGVTVTVIRGKVYRNAAGDTCTVTLLRSTSTSATTLATLTAATGGWTTQSASISDLVGTEEYYIFVAIKGSTSITDARFGWFELDYTMPDYSKGY